MKKRRPMTWHERSGASFRAEGDCAGCGDQDVAAIAEMSAQRVLRQRIVPEVPGVVEDPDMRDFWIWDLDELCEE